MALSRIDQISLTCQYMSDCLDDSKRFYKDGDMRECFYAWMGYLDWHYELHLLLYELPPSFEVQIQAIKTFTQIVDK